ncbi:MAG TPA: hypothetical protein VF026_04590 [Ktedonobacteraceae bacterium]
MNTPLHKTSTRRLEIALIAFFTLMLLSLFLFRLAVAVLELVLAVWMMQVYRHEGIWAMGRKRTAGHF